MSEYLIIIIASILAGVGTGLVGLSAATVMVPLLVVLCPSFQGTHGAFTATAIALASDILGSAVTAGVYAKNKKIDIKHSWIMLVCIIIMCTIGSVAAYNTHQQILGGFSLFLCIAIGIRFLIKPDSKKKEELSKTHNLTIKEIIISLFFGLTIGFGTGFFGSGGGMMMLIVFTAFLGYDRKTAVGTSTFIMTFTALIASISHILIEPTILLENWNFFTIAIVIATITSLISAKFANNVNTKIVGIITGIILLILGLFLVFLRYIDYINISYLFEFFKVFGIYIIFIVIAASILIIIRFTTKVPDYIFRKLLHIVAVTSIIPFVSLTNIWWISLLADILFLIIVIIALSILEKYEFYNKLFVEKGKHEVISSFVELFTLIGVFITVFWGILGPEYKFIAVTSIMAWGPGDAMAAIIGIHYGKHKLQGKMIEGTKTLEGCIAMFLTSFVCITITLILMTNLLWYQIIIISLLLGTISTFTELFTKKGMDTITVPIVTSIILYILLF